jgi:hypothetical protein
MMEAAEYRGFLKRLDASTTEWRNQVAALNIEQLNVTFSQGKTIDGEKDVCLRNLTLVHDLIETQISKDSLRDDMRLTESLADVSSMLGDIVGNLPENAQALHWASAVPSLGREIASYQAPLRRHVLAYADMLQDKAAKCAR